MFCWGITSLPILLSASVPGVDTINHTARLHVLAHINEGYQQFYQPNWVFIPNIAIDVLLVPLVKFLPATNWQRTNRQLVPLGTHRLRPVLSLRPRFWVYQLPVRALSRAFRTRLGPTKQPRVEIQSFSHRQHSHPLHRPHDGGFDGGHSVDRTQNLKPKHLPHSSKKRNAWHPLRFNNHRPPRAPNPLAHFSQRTAL